MKKTGKIIIILLTMILAAGVLTSCNPDTAPDGKSAASKKQMTEAEFRQNSQAIQSIGAVEAFAVVNSNAEARGLSENGLTYTFTGEEEVSTAEIRKQLAAMAAEAKTDAAKSFYSALASSLPADFTVEVKAGSNVKCTLNQDSIKTVSSMDITIVIDGKTIEIEKDADDRWIEIDGTFFDNTELEKMLEAAEEAAEAVKQFFENLPQLGLGFTTVINGDETKIELNIKDGDELEARITGKAALKVADGRLHASLDLSCIEYDDGKEEDRFTLEADLTISLDPKDFADIFNNLEKIADASIRINGMNVWADAFLAELD